LIKYDKIYGGEVMDFQIIDEEIRKNISDYVKARKHLIDMGNKYPDLFSGNDNMIGRIGEFFGLLYLKSIGQRPLKVPSKSNPGYDFIDEVTNVKTQVKVISCENKNGTSVRLVEPWDQFILFTLNDDYMIDKLGFINKIQFNRALEEEINRCANPIVNRSMNEPKGLVGKYGKVLVKPIL
jgi:hypothetical protein